MSLFEFIVITHLLGHLLKSFVKNEVVIASINGILVGTLSMYLFVTLVLS